MPDLVFVRANKSQPIRDGGSVSAIPSALPPPSAILSYHRPDADAGTNPSGLAGFAQTVMANRNLNAGYYYGVTGYPTDPYPGSTQPTF